MTTKAADKLSVLGCEDVLVFTNPSYDDALIGVTTDNKAVYDYELMVKSLMHYEGFDHEDAIEWIEYNTLRSLPYCEMAPIVIHRI